MGRLVYSRVLQDGTFHGSEMCALISDWANDTRRHLGKLDSYFGLSSRFDSGDPVAPSVDGPHELVDCQPFMRDRLNKLEEFIAERSR